MENLWGRRGKERDGKAMQQLELRSYSREEIAQVLFVNLKDSKHFKRNVEARLTKWGYGFRYTTECVEIKSRPETPEERLSELLIRGYNIDVQINAVQFACFIEAFHDIPGFESMPWAERAKAYYHHYYYCVDERTLRNWCSRLIERGIVAKHNQYTAWRTDVIKGIKYRSQVEEDEKEEMRKYLDRRRELVSQYYKQFCGEGMRPVAAKETAWKEAYKTLWSEYSCCYYYCKSFSFSAFTENDREILLEIYELAPIIASAAPPEEIEQRLPTTKEEFDRQWFG